MEKPEISGMKRLKVTVEIVLRIDKPEGKSKEGYRTKEMEKLDTR